MAADPLFLLRLELSMRGLYGLARTHRLPDRGDDLGYVLHAGLAALFGDLRPANFALDRVGSAAAQVLAYSAHPLDELREQAELYADPAAFRICDWERAADKPMPQRWREDQRLGFQARVCPTVRMAKGGEFHRAGAEVDAFIAAAWRAGKDVLVDREEVYRQWLSAAFDRGGGARLEGAVIENFHLEAQMRRTQGAQRKAQVRRKPDVTLRGALTITDPARFDAMLRRGLGRHRAFGFGMLLLRPEARRC